MKTRNIDIVYQFKKQKFLKKLIREIREQGLYDLTVDIEIWNPKNNTVDCGFYIELPNLKEEMLLSVEVIKDLEIEIGEKLEGITEADLLAPKLATSITKVIFEKLIENDNGDELIERLYEYNIGSEGIYIKRRPPVVSREI